MFIKNNSARLITITFEAEEYKLMPAGDAVEIPSAAKKECKFLNILLDDGSVVEERKSRAAKPKQEAKELEELENKEELES